MWHRATAATATAGCTPAADCAVRLAADTLAKRPAGVIAATPRATGGMTCAGCIAEHLQPAALTGGLVVAAGASF